MYFKGLTFIFSEDPPENHLKVIRGLLLKYYVLLLLLCSLLNDSNITGKRSNVLYTFSTNTKIRSLPFEIQLINYLWNKINTKYISEVTFYMTDDEDRELDLNGIDISFTIVMKSE